MTSIRHAEFLRRCAVNASRRRLQRLFDRNCHGGPVEFRLPLFYRIDCANGRYRQ